MTDIEAYQKAFKNPEYLFKWAKQIEYISLTEDITDLLKAEIIGSYSFLRNELGNGFLKTNKVYRRFKHHPIHSMLSNKAPWQMKDLVRFTQNLKQIKANEISNYPYLLKKLKPSISCRNEGIPFTDIAASFIASGFEVCFLEERKNTKTPDIKVLNNETQEHFFIEVSKLHDSGERIDFSNNYHKLFFKLHDTPPNLPCSCIQLEFISDSEMERIYTTLDSLKEMALKNDELITYIDKFIDIAIVPVTKREELKEWCQKNGERREWVTGLPLNFDETDRIIKNNKIKDKAMQIPKESPGMIYIPVNPLYFKFGIHDDAIDKIEEEIAPFSNILGMVLYSYIGDKTNGVVIKENGHYLSRKMINEANYRDIFFVYNHNFKLPLRDNTLSKIYKSFENFDVTFL